MTRTDWQNDGLQLVRSHLPELAGESIYLIDGDELPEQDKPPRHVLGVTSRSAAHAYSDWLQARGEWQGPGEAIVYMASRFEFDTSDLHPASIVFLRRKFSAAIVVHELAHVVADRALREMLKEHGIDDSFQPDKQLVRAAIATVPQKSTACPWHLHELPFIRAGLHIAHRAAVDPGLCALAGESYGLSSWQTYRDVFNDELAAQSLPITAVLTTIPPPPAAVELFETDKLTYQQRNAA